MRLEAAEMQGDVESVLAGWREEAWGMLERGMRGMEELAEELEVSLPARGRRLTSGGRPWRAWQMRRR